MPNGHEYRIVVLGDSIQWGQGLLEPQKFSELVRQTIGRELGREAIIEHRFANSGAVLGAPGDTWAGSDMFDQHSPQPFWGEVPNSRGTPNIPGPGIHAQFTALRDLLITH